MTATAPPAALPTRLWVYQAERFPLGKSALLILVFAASCVLYGGRLQPGGNPSWRGVLSAAVVLFCFFLQLRVADEHKDLEDDRRYRPERPVPRGLVTLAELRGLAIAGAIAQVAATLWLDVRLLPLLGGVWAWMGLMTAEFFRARWLKAHPVVYLFSHMAVMPMFALFALTCGTAGWPAATPGTMGVLALALFNGLALELGRKTWAPADERDGVETYSKLWGPAVTGAAVAVAIAGAVVSGAVAQAGAGLNLLWFAPAAAVAAAAWTAIAGYVRQPVAARAKRVELLTGVFTLSAYLKLIDPAPRGPSMSATDRPAGVLTGAGTLDRRQAGGKGAILAELAAAFPVPPFFVIRPGTFERELDEPVRRAIEAALRTLGPGPFAVRSSGVDEDGVDAAHAGQFETRLNVPAGAVIEAAHAVWRSGFSESLAQYRRAHGLSDTPQPPAVVVQTMVTPKAAGVAFSADPVSGKRDVVVVSAVAGLADRLVGGEVDGDTWRVDGEGMVDLQARQADVAVLTDAEVGAVAALARRAEAFYGAPQDVEWALDATGLKLLQSRPITTLGEAADEAVSLWDNSNIVESYPGIVSPMTFSFARSVYGHVYRAFTALMGVDRDLIAANRAAFDGLLGRAYGRVYYNLLAWYRLLSLLPGFKANRAYMEQMMGVGEPLPEALARRIAPPTADRGARLLDNLRLARVALGLAWHGVVLPRAIRRFYRRLDEALAYSDGQIEALPASEIAVQYRALEARLLERWDAPLINDLLCMIAFGASRKALERWGGADGLALHSDVMIGQGDIVSAEPARRIAQMGAMARLDPAAIAAFETGRAEALSAHPDLAVLFQDYLQKFGDRCTEELKLESVTLHEDPRALMTAVAAAARGKARQGPDRGAEPRRRLRAMLPGKPVRQAVAGLLLRWARDRVRDRENLRFERTRLFGRVRRLVRAGGLRLASAGLLDHERDVFFLTLEEWLGALEGGGVTRDLKGLASLRRAEDADDRSRLDPPERFEVRGAFASGLASLRARTGGAVAQDGESRTGQACCAGVVTARVRVIADPRTQSLEPGEIMVARHTDPGWIAVFANASGVIAERGSLLSHSAIVAREMGVPCVVALKDATGWLRTGDLVRLDGGSGLVERLEPAP